MAGETVERAIFISYRRDDSEGEAGRLFDDLVAAFGEQSVFMDVSGIQPGLDFRKAIDDNVKSCGVLLAILGPQWSSIADASGGRRLENPNDFVRLEIASALEREIPVIPVLVHAAKMPTAADLPDNLKDLTFRNSVEITHARWNSDVALLVQALKSYVSVSKKHETETVHATIPVQLPAPQSAGRSTEPKQQKSLKIPIIAAVAVVLVVIGIVIASRSGQKTVTTPVETTGTSPQSGTTGAAADPSGAVAVMAKSADFLGDWQNQLGQSDALRQHVTRLELTPSGQNLLVHAWATYEGGEQDWGTETANWQNGQFVAAGFAPRFNRREKEQDRETTLNIAGLNGTLHVAEVNSWKLKTGVASEATLNYTFAKAH